MIDASLLTTPAVAVVVAFTFVFILLWLFFRARARLKVSRQLSEEREALYRGLFESSLAGIALISADGRLLEANERLQKLLSIDPDLGHSPSVQDIPWQDKAIALAHLAKTYPSGVQHETSFIAADGNRHWVALRHAPVQQSREEGSYWLLVNDISHLQAERAMMRLALKAYESISEGIMITDATTRIIDVNPAFERITGYSRDEVIGMRASVLSSGRHDPQFFSELWKSLTEQAHWAGEIWNRCRDGEIIPCLMHIDAVADPDTELATHYVGVFSNISERIQAEERISFIANHDALTGLANRFALDAVLPQSIALARRNGQHLALLFLDLDRFKAINDQFGHAIGDQVLIEASRRLISLLRESDFLARLGGDEFIIMLSEIDGSEDALRVAEAAARIFDQAIIAGGAEINISFSIGISVFPEDGETAGKLLNKADMAMYRVKSRGRNGFSFHSSPVPNTDS